MHLRKWPSKTGKSKSEASITAPIGHRRVSPSRRTWSGLSRLSIPFGFFSHSSAKGGFESLCVNLAGPLSNIPNGGLSFSFLAFHWLRILYQ
ncbi:hypothetical protein JMJ77_0005456 [Colletotrichum scovillei]|uniref:Uncharacterized protein n=1 Tax=Colletotrichum scovillei TaxID=1209932 RepID=A0A9P7RJ25_9PEZI|nr:hypothetical protein JMJ77_0005456 [Colletotrichum scovillei]KAG7076654.1 hypothetical protein JMJ76_0013915 [Colletotrichum scovillei]KAG7083869.1 hypothetical protein JMJ78_0009310 [Colletotrichum scovillei]